MKNLAIRLFIILITCSITACFNYETQFDGAYELPETSPDEAPNLDKKLVVVAGGKVYLMDEYGENTLEVDNSGTVSIASINNIHTKIIFRRQNEDIQIYDIETESITGSVPNSNTAKWFDYHSNNESIYFLNENSDLVSFGPKIVPNNLLNLETHSNLVGNYFAKGVVILENTNIIFSMESNFTGNKYLCISDGTTIQEHREVNFGFSHFRINEKETALWMRNSSSLNLYSLPSISFSDRESEYRLGVPTENISTGFRISESNRIITPLSLVIPSPNGVITSFDY